MWMVYGYTAIPIQPNSFEKKKKKSFNSAVPARLQITNRLMLGPLDPSFTSPQNWGFGVTVGLIPVWMSVLLAGRWPFLVGNEGMNLIHMVKPCSLLHSDSFSTFRVSLSKSAGVPTFTWQFWKWPFWDSDVWPELKACWWPPTGNKKVTSWITW